MAYLGRGIDKISNVETLDNITFDGSSSYSLTKNSVAFVPSAPQNIILSIDGVVQSGNFSISGSTINFGVAVSSSSVCNFIIHLGIGLTNVPSDSSVTKTKTNFVSTGTGYTGTGLDIKGDGSANGRLGLLCSAGTHGVALESPDHSAGQSYTIKLPDNQIAADKVIKIKSISGSGNTAIGQAEFASAGKILQVSNQVILSTQQTLSSNTYTDLTGASINITPSSSSSKILLSVAIAAKHDDVGSGFGLKFLRDSTGVFTTLNDYAVYSVDGTDRSYSTFQFIDSPSSTNQINYKVQVATYLSREIRFNNAAQSTFYLMEIAG